MSDTSGRGWFRVVLGALAVVLLLVFAWKASELLILFFIAVLLAVYLSALTDWFQRRLRMPRPLGIASGVVLTVVAFWGVGFLLVPPLTAQVGELLSVLPRRLMIWEADLVRLGESYPVVRDLLGPIEEGGSYFGSIFGEIGSWFSDAVPYVFTGLWFLVHAFSVLAMAIFLTAKPALYRSELLQLVPPRNRVLASDILVELAATLRAWLGGQLMAMAVLGVFTWIGLELLRVPYALAFGVFTGLAVLVPFFGGLFSTILPALYVLPAGGGLYALAVLLLGVVVHVVEANVVAPKVFEKQVRLPPVWTLLSVLIALKLLGPIGMIVAVPILAVGRVLVKRLYVERVLEGGGYHPILSDEPIVITVPEGVGLSLSPEAERSVPGMLEVLDT
ncbi:MAG: AI-2E family transporter [marine benthic group bacterium]|jgi:predicted PurR-regulated permease PerM|nr:AI-2E family transporter [Candidatus Benthicola marisminoris]